MTENIRYGWVLALLVLLLDLATVSSNQILAFLGARVEILTRPALLCSGSMRLEQVASTGQGQN